MALGVEEYNSYSFTASAVDGGEWSASRPVRASPPGKDHRYPFVQVAGWAPEPVWTQRLVKRSFCLSLGSNPDRPIIKNMY
jgi:hypothetical protein